MHSSWVKLDWNMATGQQEIPFVCYLLQNASLDLAHISKSNRFNLTGVFESLYSATVHPAMPSMPHLEHVIMINLLSWSWSQFHVNPLASCKFVYVLIA